MANRLRKPNPRERAAVANATRLALSRTSRELQASFEGSRRFRDTLEKLHALALAEQPPEPKTKAAETSARIARIVDGLVDGWARPLFEKFGVEYALPLEEGARRAFTQGARDAITKVGMRGSFELRNPRVLNAIQDRANELAGDVSASTFEGIKDTIARGFWTEGLGPLQVAQRLEDEFDSLSKARAVSIARTEILIAQSQGAFRQYEEIGVHRKDWLDTDDGRTRPTHREAGRTQKGIPIDEPFHVGKALLMYPGDPSGPPEEIILCRCDHAPIVEEARTGRPWDGS